MDSERRQPTEPNAIAEDRGANEPSSSQFEGPEFPDEAAPWRAEMDRRRFLQLMGSSLVLAGLAGCRPKLAERIVPYVKAPEEIIPGEPLYYATALTLGGYATGVTVRTEMGRPIKIEGNPDHPSSRGGTDIFAQASILGLYDPDRSRSIRQGRTSQDWTAFSASAQAEYRRLKAARGAGLAILTETVTSPTLATEIAKVLRELPLAKWHCYEPIDRSNVYEGSKLAFGEDVEPVYRFRNADVIVTLDADFLYQGPGRNLYSREFSERRKVRKGSTDMVRLYVIESTPTNTGATADHRLSLRAGEVARFAAALAVKLAVGAPSPGAISPDWEPWIDAIADDLRAHRGRAVIVPGEGQPPVVHAIAHSINESLGAFGKTLAFLDPIPLGTRDQRRSLTDLVERMERGQVQSLLILGGNPAYSSPIDLPFADALPHVPFSVHLSSHVDETTDHCLWHVPMAHELESWGDAKSFDGTVSIQQPLIEPLYGGRTAIEMLSTFAGRTASGRDLVQSTWREGREAFDDFWSQSLSDGFVAPGPPATRDVSVRKGWFSGTESLERPEVEGLEINFRPDPCLYDGRYSNNAWLQELPKPISKIVWDNVAVVAPETAKLLGITNRVGPTGKEILVTLVDLTYRGRTLTRIPVWIQPGQPAGSVALHLGGGRLRSGAVGNSVGFNAFALRTADSPHFEDGVKLALRSEEYSIATTQVHGMTEGRHELRVLDIADFDKLGLGETKHEDISMYPPRPSEGYAWAMVFDTNICTGCNACIVACQAENNIPTVGKTEVLRGRDMHWLRIDRYFLGPKEDEIHHLPVNCMHCEKAPCEVVCPVAATVHSAEGLNEMVYNRCIGTRYCSNNCPYKARRFNFRQYVDKESAVLKLMRNPDVTVRGRGVMEKCTYCVQRINAARKTAKKEGRKIREGEFQTACQAACPAGGITFGDLSDPQSAVSQLRKEPHHFTLLEELNTRPRTTYLARFRNTNPKLLEALQATNSEVH